MRTGVRTGVQYKRHLEGIPKFFISLALIAPAHSTKYSVTRIYLFEYINDVQSAYEVIVEPSRRAILSLLASSERSVGEIESQLRLPQPTVSKHLKVLRDAGFVESQVHAQRRVYRLKPEPLKEVDEWLTQFRQFWSPHVDALERHLDRMYPETNLDQQGETQ